MHHDRRGVIVATRAYWGLMRPTSCRRSAWRVRTCGVGAISTHLRGGRLRGNEPQCRLPLGIAQLQDGRFGACLMRTPALVGECLASMTQHSHVDMPAVV